MFSVYRQRVGERQRARLLKENFDFSGNDATPDREAPPAADGAALDALWRNR